MREFLRVWTEKAHSVLGELGHPWVGNCKYNITGFLVRF